MPKVFEQETDVNVYHYTDLNAMISILSKDKIVLRATNVLYLNDPHELLEGIDVINEILKDKIHPGAFRNYYLTSFSANKDSLSMWGMYAANGNGCALAFDYDELSKVYPIMIKCIYGKDDIEHHFNSFHRLAQTGSFSSFGGSKPSKEDEEYNREALVLNNIIITYANQ